MPRELTDIEKEYISNHSEMSPRDLAEKMEGIGEKTIKKYKKELLSNEDTKSVDEIHKNLRKEEKGMIEEQLINDKDPEGVTIMKPGASTMSDARRVLRIKSRKDYSEKHSDKIHTIRK